jgi:hypothetical protein
VGGKGVALIAVEWIRDEELLLRGLLFVEKEPRYVDKGVLNSLIFRDKGGCPSVHMGKYVNFKTLIEEEPARFGFAVLSAMDIRVNQLGEVIHNPTEHDSHALIVPPPEINSQNKERRWRGLLTNQVWDLISAPERVAQLR